MPARGPRPLVQALRGAAWVSIIAGVYLAFFGAGAREWLYALAGPALMALALPLWLASKTRVPKPRSFVSGTVRVLSVSDPPSGPGAFARCEMRVFVDAPRVAQREVTIRDPRVPVDSWPEIGETLPALIGTHDPRAVRVQWD